MKAWLKRTATGLAVLGGLSPAASWGFCNTNSFQTNAVSAYGLSGQGNFSCADLNMVPASASITNPSALGGKGVDWALTGAEVDAVTVADSSGKRCVYNYGPGATGGQGLTPNSNKSAVEVFACADGDVPTAPNSAPTVEIIAPIDNETYAGGEEIAFSATADDAEDGPIAAISWTSSLEGSLGTGESFTKVLGPGTHTISAQVQDNGGLVGADSVTVTVEAVVVAQCQTIDGGSAVLINGTAVTCPSDGEGGFLPRVVCSADISDTADKFELENQGCCVCGAEAIECNPSLPSSATGVEDGQPGPCPRIKPDFDNLQVPTTILFNNDPYYCTTIGGKRKCYAY
jgi:hypothetical protein